MSACLHGLVDSVALDVEVAYHAVHKKCHDLSWRTGRIQVVLNDALERRLIEPEPIGCAACIVERASERDDIDIC